MLNCGYLWELSLAMHALKMKEIWKPGVVFQSEHHILSGILSRVEDSKNKMQKGHATPNFPVSQSLFYLL